MAACAFVAELAKIQDALPARGFNKGYLSAFPESFIDRVEKRERVWAPYYTLHKIMAGLLDMYLYCDNDQALDVVLQAKGLGMVRSGNLIRVAQLSQLQKERELRLAAAKQEYELTPLETRLIPVSYANADSIQPRTKELLSPRGSVAVDERTNVLIARDISVAAARESALQKAPLLVAAEISEVGGRGGEVTVLLSLATAIEEAWLVELFPGDYHETKGVAYDEQTRRVIARRERRFRDLVLEAKAGGDGRLFGSITAGDVSDAILEAREVRVDKRHITVDPPIRAAGTYTVPVDMGDAGITEVKTIVSPLGDE